jgi:hypothetical protein
MQKNTVLDTNFIKFMIFLNYLLCSQWPHDTLFQLSHSHLEAREQSFQVLDSQDGLPIETKEDQASHFRFQPSQK